jgi:hydroxyacyl-ACP dehydratase HTD2-like protein with hotdog domain
MPLDIDPSILGREFDRAEHDPVTAEALISFALALGETYPCYIQAGPELIAHPTYCVRFKGNKFFPDTLPETLRFRMSFDAGKDIALGAPIRPGDVITIVSTLHEVYEKTGRTGSMIFVVVRFTMTNQRSENVAVVDNRCMYKGLAG